MSGTGKVTSAIWVALALLGAGTALWLMHARARALGGGAEVLGYDAAQYAVAARELAEHGRLATPFALPVELSRATQPPWPLALVQPGLVLAEAALFRVSGTPPAGRAGALVLVFPFLCYLGTALALAFSAWSLISRGAPDVPDEEAALAALAVGLAFLLDPEAQHYASGGFTEMPFTFGLSLVLAALARGPRMPALGFGLLLGATGLFRGNMLWMAPAFAAAYAWASPRRARPFFMSLAGYALVLAPWWFYKWRAFGDPGWDLSRLSVWDGIGGRTWFSLNHLPQLPELPHGMAAVLALKAKLLVNLRALSLEIATGPRTLWLAGLAVVIFGGAGTGLARGPVSEVPPSLGRGPRAAALAAALALILSVLTAAISVPLFRYVLPARLIAEGVGLVAVGAFLWNMPAEWATPRSKRVCCGALALLALTWGAWQSGRGLQDAARVTADRGIPPRKTFEELSRQLDDELRPGEPVMSNLGPTLAWYTRRPVLHLSLTPGDMEACRERLQFDEVVLAFRQSSRAWPGWDELMSSPAEAPQHKDWNVRRVRAWSVRDGFQIVWLELGPPLTPLALTR